MRSLFSGDAAPLKRCPDAKPLFRRPLTRCCKACNCYNSAFLCWTTSFDCRYREPELSDCFGPGGVAGAPGARVSGGASDNALRMNPGGTVAVRIARSPDCSTLRLSKKGFTSALV